MTYQEALDYLYSRLPMYQRIGNAAYKKDLTNTIALCAHLKHPERAFLSIHIAGTNGKGSTSHLLAAMLQGHGMKVGLYTSPHYKDFRERIKINGEYISEKEVVQFVELHRESLEVIEPSFFEMTVAMAFDHFSRHQVDIAVIETGLGGRLDSTNVIQPILSLITNISFDHMEMLGNTLPLIAYEKAGIIKKNTPVVIGEKHPETAPVFQQKADQENAHIVFASDHVKVFRLSESPGKSVFQAYLDGEPWLDNLEVGFSGPFQSLNLASVLQCYEILRVIKPELLNWNEDGLRDGLKNLVAYTRFQGRWQWISQDPPILADSAHNEGGLRIVLQHLRTLDYKSLHIVTGFVSDKNISPILDLFPRDARYYFAKANIPRGLDAGALRDQAREHGLSGEAYPSVAAALEAARREYRPGDLIFIAGSIFVVAEILPG